jgi:hypothetical protein
VVIYVTFKMLDFQRSIVDFFAGFVVIKNGGNVAMIHQIAREYLLSGNDCPFHIDKDAAHKQVFLNCMQCLMAIGLRAKVKGSQRPEFLDYASSLWSSHLISTPLDCDQVVEVLNKILTGQWVLKWIQVLATSRHWPYSFKRQNIFQIILPNKKNSMQHGMSKIIFS